MLNDYLLFLGRFHPVILHLPIGILVMTFCLEFLALRPRYAEYRPAVRFGLMAGIISSLVAALLGYFLSLEGGYDAEMLFRHQWLGFATVVLAFILYMINTRWAAENVIARKAYLPLWVFAMGVLALAGHFGGTLTHGEGYLTEHTPEPFRSLAGLPPKTTDETPVIDLDSTVVFQDIIFPILDNKCLGCHNPAKRKGELLLNTPEGILAGGEEGKVIVAGNVDQSSIYQRLILPLEEKKRMPPKGKKQLTPDEIKLIHWWVAQGASFTAQIASIQTPEEVSNILASMVTPANPLLTLDIPPLDEDALSDLRNAGISAQRVSQDVPFLEIKLAYRQDLSEKLLKSLLPYSDQIVTLELQNSNIRNNMLNICQQLPHLQRLRLDNTAINDSAMHHLGNLAYLENLNLVNTGVSATGLAHLNELSHLKKLYIWQTNITRTAFQSLEAFQNTTVEFGVEADSIFQKARLKPPLMVFEQSLFEQSTTVSLETNLSGADIRYTLDGSTPDQQSPQYSGPLTVDQSCQLSFVAFKEGWLPSEVATQVFVKINNRVANIRLRHPPNPKYQGNGAASLIDLKKGDADFRSGYWLGFEAEDLVATLDLGTTMPLNQVSVGCLEDVGSWIFYPVGVDIAVSRDGKSFRKINQNDYPATDYQTQPSQKFFVQEFPETEARYVQVSVRNLTTVPDWHIGAGGKAWVFVDEILVE